VDYSSKMINGHELVWDMYVWSLADKADCSCGWKGIPYWDGIDLSYDDWEEHANASPTSADVIIEGIGL